MGQVVTQPRINPTFYFLVRGIINGLFALLSHRKISGLEHVPARGPYLMVSNHLGTFDPPLIMAALPVQLTVFAASTHRHDFFSGELLNQLGAIWVRRGEIDRQALRTALAVLQAGGVIGIAPEGTRSKTGALQPGKVGAAYLATRARVPLLPVVVTGTETLTATLKRFKRPRLTVTIGPLFHLPENERAAPAELEVYTTQIMHTLAAMLPERYRGVYAQLPASSTEESG
jgi:1-acyl-sn-glycerol-3-phosphate acyltransferase